MELIKQGNNNLVYRAHDSKLKRPVVLKLPKDPFPSAYQLAAYQNEFRILSVLHEGEDSFFRLEEFYNRPLLVTEDTRGMSLEQFLEFNKPVSTLEAMELAIGLVKALVNLHSKQINHKKITPGNIILKPQTKEVWFIDFSKASQSNVEYNKPGPFESLDEVLAYLPPEQTGRLPRPVDHRSDLYALGVVFFEMLAGEPPFQADSSLELIQQQLSKAPPSLVGLNPGLPRQLAKIVEKLLQKDPKDRYQSATGLLHDLELCLSGFKQTGNINMFPIAQKDRAVRFEISGELFDRTDEVKALRSALGRASHGEREFLLITGHTGQGKTSLVLETNPYLECKSSLFLQTKFDPVRQGQPYNGMIGLIEDLFNHLLALPKEQLEASKALLKEKLGPNGRVLFSLTPEAKLILGDAKSLPPLPPLQEKNRFELTLLAFFSCFISEDKPLVLFFDDIHFADPASLRLLELLLIHEDNKGLLAIGTVRPSFLEKNDNLAQMVDRFRKKMVLLKEIKLRNFTETGCQEYLGQIFKSQVDLVGDLAKELFRQTHGNPFEFRQKLVGLFQEGLVRYDEKVNKWDWDLETISLQQSSEQVANYMSQRLNSLPERKRNLLQSAACIGTSFEPEKLSCLLSFRLEELDELVEEGMLQRVRHHSTHHGVLVEALEYRFIHDRLQYAAYDGLPETERLQKHREIGLSLLEALNEQSTKQEIFECTSHLNLASNLIDSPKLKDRLVDLNIKAANASRSSSAYDGALELSLKALTLMGEDPWKKDLHLCFQLHMLIASSYFLLVEHEKMQEYLSAALEHALEPLDQAEVYELMIHAHMAQNQPAKAIEIGLNALRSMGVKLSMDPKEIDIILGLVKLRFSIGNKLADDFAVLPLMEDPYHIAQLRLLANMISPSHLARPLLLPLIVFKSMELSYRHGISPYSIPMFAVYGGAVLCGEMGKLKEGIAFGDLSLNLIERLDAKEQAAMTYLITADFISHWHRSTKEGLSLLKKGINVARETGDLEYFGYSSLTYCYHKMYQSYELNGLLEEMKLYLHRMKQAGQELSRHYLSIFAQAIQNLITAPSDPTLLNGSFCNEERLIEHFQSKNDPGGMINLGMNKIMLFYLFGEYTKCLHEIEKGKSDYLKEQFTSEAVLIPYYESLCLIQLYKTLTKEGQRSALKEIYKNLKMMQKWLQLTGDNHLHKDYLIRAGLCAMQKDLVGAMEYYRKSINHGKKQGVFLEVGIASERAAEFYLEMDEPAVAETYLIGAYQSFRQWGAKSKMEMLKESYPSLAHRFLESDWEKPQSSSDLMAQENQIDFESLLVAYQTLSNQIQKEPLIKKLLQLILQTSEMQRALFLTVIEGQALLEAEALADQQHVELKHQQPLESVENLPKSLIYYSIRKKETLYLADSDKSRFFGKDQYFKVNPKSQVAVLPVIRYGQVIGVIYMENKAQSKKFAAERLKTLELLSLQVAISLQNAELYESLQEHTSDLERKVSERTTELNSSLTELEQSNNKILGSIEYAKLLQASLLPTPEQMELSLSNSFCLLEPMEMVSGDFLIADKFKKGVIVGAFDCTGHGVPAAFLTMLAYSNLSRIIYSEKILDPGKVMRQLQDAFMSLPAEQGGRDLHRSGLDGALCFIDVKKKTLTFAGAGRSLLYFCEEGAKKLKGTKKGLTLGAEAKQMIRAQTLDLKKGMKFYLYTDGYADQRGQEKGFSYGQRNFETLLERISSYPFDRQKHTIEEEFKKFQGSRPNQDDRLLIGFDVDFIH